jgi:hypothetical protein
MKLNFDLLFASVLFAVSLYVSAETETTCTRNSDGAIIATTSGMPVTDTDGNTGDACKEIPDFYEIKVFRFGLCTANLYTNNDLPSCSFLVNSDTGVDHVISYPQKASLDTSSAMSLGTYDHMVLVLENKLGIKHTEQFSIAVNGATSSGTQCWTIDSTTAYAGGRDGVLNAGPETPAMDCGDNTPAAAYTYEIFDSFGEGGDGAIFSAVDDDGMSMSSGTMRAKLLEADLTTATKFQNADRLLVAAALSASKTVTTTSAIELKFKMTDSVSVDLGYNEDDSKLFAIKSGADPFQVDLVITN